MEIVGKVIGINTSDSKHNLTVEGIDGTYNVKTLVEQNFNIVVGSIYRFSVDIKEGVRTAYYVSEYMPVDDLPLEQKDEVLRHYMTSSPISLEEEKKIIEEYLEKIENKILKDITLALIKKYENKYYTYPAATKMHHAYVGGLAYHVIGMLKMADGFLEIYPYIDKNYLYAGIILHDLGKTMEFTGNENTQYSLEGQLLGHITIGIMEVTKEAEALGYTNTKEVLYLCHMILSHHGQPQFGSPKKPMFAEAVALSFIDNADSKFRILGEELDKTSQDEYTDTIGVLERMKMYKI